MWLYISNKKKENHGKQVQRGLSRSEKNRKKARGNNGAAKVCRTMW